MNGQEDSSSSPSCLPLYPPDSHHHHHHHNPHPQHHSKTGLTGVEEISSNSQQSQQHHYMNHPHPPPPSFSSATSSSSPFTPSSRATTWHLDFVTAAGSPPTISSHSQHNPPNGLQRLSLPPNSNNAHGNNNNNNSDSLHTPTAFFTPNEPSPKFMNSPIFSYSNPDTSLYQGPFSPVRASSLYPPPSSPFTNLSLNSPLHTPQTPSNGNGNGGGGGNNNGSGNNGGGGGPTSSSISSSSSVACFNIVPSTLLSPAPSQASTNSLSYEDLHEKSLSFFTPVWSIFMTGTKVRFVSGMNSMDWYHVDFLAQSGESLGLKGEYAPHGLEVRKFVKTSSPKERIRVTFCPVGAPNHPQVEIDCEPGHPFMVDKKGWCALKPEIFQEIYGTQCQPLECGDVCLSLGAARSPSIFIQHHPQQQQQQIHLVQHHLHHHQNHNSSSPGSTLTTTITSSSNNGSSLSNGHIIHHNNNNHHSNGSSNNNNNGLTSIKMEMDEKIVPISILPQHHLNHHHHIHQLQSMPHSPSNNNNNNNNNNNGPVIIGKKSTFASPMALQKGSNNTASNKKLKRLATENKFQPGGGGNHNNNSSTNGTNNNAANASNAAPGEKVKGRRPMNAFLLFAKDKRPELIQMYPGKDNRSISVLLGEAWQSLAPTEREKYASNAKARAEEQKRIHPDCWKRKRSQSTNSQ